MDFTKIKPVSFTRRPQADGTPPGLTVKALARRQAMLAEAVELLTHGLPGPGESLHALMTGRYDLMSLLVVILEKIPAVCSHLRIATLSFNARNVYDLEQLLTSKRVTRVTLLASKFFKEHNTSEYQQARIMLAKYPPSRLAAARSHSKVVCMSFADGGKLVTEGSANLRTNGNWEQVTVINHAGLHDWHALWIDQTVTTHESETREL